MGFESLRSWTPRWVKQRIPLPIRRRFNAWLRTRAWRGGFDPVASLEDLRACYRLLLGRLPDPDGWKTFEATVRDGGMPLETLVQLFVASPEFRARVHLTPEAPPAPVPIALPEFKIFVSPHDLGVGRSIRADRAYEPHVTTVMRAHLRPGHVLVDIGANIGYFSLLGAALVGATGRVLSFEPDPRSVSLLCASALVNGFHHIEVHPVAVAEERRVVLLRGLGSSGSIATLDGSVEQLAFGTAVPAVPLDQALRHIERLDVIKLDIEGAEPLALAGALATIRRHRPVLFSECAPAALQTVAGVSGEEYLQRITREGYDIAVIRDEGRLLGCGTDASRVLRAVDSAVGSHVDIVAHPR